MHVIRRRFVLAGEGLCRLCRRWKKSFDKEFRCLKFFDFLAVKNLFSENIVRAESCGLTAKILIAAKAGIK